MFEITPQLVQNSLGSGVEVMYVQGDLYKVVGIKPSPNEKCRLTTCGLWLYVDKDTFYVRIPNRLVAA